MSISAIICQDPKEDLAKEIFQNSEQYQLDYENWEDFMNSEDFEFECDRLKSKFYQGFLAILTDYHMNILLLY